MKKNTNLSNLNLVIVPEAKLIEIIQKTVNEALQNASLLAPEQVFLSIHEASKLVGLTETTIYQKTSKNQIPHIKKNGKVYFEKADLVAWMQEGKVKTQAQIEAYAEKYIKKTSPKYY